ncbi:MAG: ADP-ribosylglycohydrolase family protein [Xanthomonadales bacterium]|nr:ADP-ribosylglycohydrolase family protein [Xanthomonadales bacterium]
MDRNPDATAGSLIGTAVGDALGLPYEGLRPTRARRLLGPPDRYRFLLGRGMVSDDTEHSCLVALALARSGGDPEAFARGLSWGLRWWLLGPPAGIGWATLRAIVRLWLGFGWKRSGVWSAGNGPAMRSAVIGAAVHDPDRMVELVSISAQITHRDPLAATGALVVALAAAQSAQGRCDAEALLAELAQRVPDVDPLFVGRLGQAVHSVKEGESIESFLRDSGQSAGVSGYVVDTVAVAIRIWLAFPNDFESALTAAVSCGGDADTLAAIVGGIVGARVGPSGIPRRWRQELCEWPRSLDWMLALASRTDQSLTAGTGTDGIRYGFWFGIPRNLLFFTTVVVHLLRRALPPY